MVSAWNVVMCRYIQWRLVLLGPEGDRAITVRDLSNGKMLMPEPPGVQVRRHLFEDETTILKCNAERSVDIVTIPFICEITRATST